MVWQVAQHNTNRTLKEMDLSTLSWFGRRC